MTKEECAMCLDHGAWKKMPCGDHVCDMCLKEQASRALHNSELIPLRCCGCDYDPDVLTYVYESNDLQTYYTRLREKSREEFQRLLNAEYQELVVDNKWALCPSCGVGIERISGCNHVSCRCGTSFCYLCEAQLCLCGKDGYTARIAPVVHKVKKCHSKHVWAKQHSEKACDLCKRTVTTWYQCQACLAERCVRCRLK